MGEQAIKEAGELTITINAKPSYDPNSGTGSLRMKFSDNCVVVSDGDNKIGEINGCIGADTELIDHRVKLPDESPNWAGKTQVWVISAKDLWDAFQGALSDAGISVE